MSEIFISYAREDRLFAKKLASDLESLTISVWWDKRLKINEIFDNIIQEQINKTRRIIVVWSGRSIASRWVKKEALIGFKKGKLIQVLIEDVVPPKRFRRYHAADLTSWDGIENSAEYKKFMTFIYKGLRPLEPGYYMDIEAVNYIESPNGRMTGEHLVKSLKKAPKERLSWFMHQHGIHDNEGRLIIGVRTFDNDRIVIDKFGWKLKII